MLPETEHPLVGKKAELNEKIFPRTGDITALHDPQVARLDQTVSNYPLGMIQKVLIVCSMDTAARGKKPSRRLAFDIAKVPLPARSTPPYFRGARDYWYDGSLAGAGMPYATSHLSLIALYTTSLFVPTGTVQGAKGDVDGS